MVQQQMFQQPMFQQQILVHPIEQPYYAGAAPPQYVQGQPLMYSATVVPGQPKVI